jgi:hypothetical protein
MSVYIVSSAAHYVLNYHQWNMRLRRSLSDLSNSWTGIQNAEEDTKKFTCRHVSWYDQVYHRWRLFCSVHSCVNVWWCLSFTLGTLTQLGKVWKNCYVHYWNSDLSKPSLCRLGGMVVYVLATGPKGCGFKPGWGDGFLRVIKIRNTPSLGWEVKLKVPCRKILQGVKDPLRYFRYW